MTSPRRFGDTPYGGATQAPDWIASRSAGQPPEPPASLQHILALQSWDTVKLPTAQDFTVFTTSLLSLPALVNGTVSTTAATGGVFLLPANNIGVLQTVTFSIAAPGLTDLYRFTVFENGTGIPGLTNVGFQPVVASYFALPIKSIWQLSKGAQLGVTFVNVGGTGPLSVGISLSGFHVPEADVFAYTGQRKGQLNAANPDRSNLAR